MPSNENISRLENYIRELEIIKIEAFSNDTYTHFIKKFKIMGLSNDLIKKEIGKLKDMKFKELKKALNKKFGMKSEDE